MRMWGVFITVTLVTPNIIYTTLRLQEDELRIRNEKKDQEEETKFKLEEEDDLSPRDRYKKLCDLLGKSKFYSNFLLEKMEREDDESKQLKNKNLAGRTAGKENNNQVCRN